MSIFSFQKQLTIFHILIDEVEANLGTFRVFLL